MGAPKRNKRLAINGESWIVLYIIDWRTLGSYLDISATKERSGTTMLNLEKQLQVTAGIAAIETGVKFNWSWTFPRLTIVCEDKRDNAGRMDWLKGRAKKMLYLAIEMVNKEVGDAVPQSG